jgi:hypothetical protein
MVTCEGKEECYFRGDRVEPSRDDKVFFPLLGCESALRLRGDNLREEAEEEVGIELEEREGEVVGESFGTTMLIFGGSLSVCVVLGESSVVVPFPLVEGEEGETGSVSASSAPSRACAAGRRLRSMPNFTLLISSLCVVGFFTPPLAASFG